MNASSSLFFQFGRFLSAGVFATAAHYAVLIGLVQFLDIDPVIASVFGFGTGAMVNYYVNYHYTFNSTHPHTTTLPRFLIVALIGMIMNTTAMAIQVKTLGFHYLMAQVVATIFVVMWNFTGNRLWTFDHRRSQQ